MSHRDKHPTFVPECFGCKAATISISPAATPTRANAAYRSAVEMERRWERDMPAYKRLRVDGLQPRRIEGCADLEARASDRFEVETGLVAPDRTALDIAKDVSAATKGG